VTESDSDLSLKCIPIRTEKHSSVQAGECVDSQVAHSDTFRSESESLFLRDRNPIRKSSWRILEQTLSDMSADRLRVRSEFSFRIFEEARSDHSSHIRTFLVSSSTFTFIEFEKYI
jgi:hypothetical protein